MAGFQRQRDEIDRRLSVVSRIEQLCLHRSVDEAMDLHPPVTQERWLFGPEFDCLDYVSNESLRAAAEQVLRNRDGRQPARHGHRPDLMHFADATCSIVAMEPFALGPWAKPTARDLLLIELKAGSCEITDEDIREVARHAEGICEVIAPGEFPACTVLVVGHRLAPAVCGDWEAMSEGRVIHRRIACTYQQLIRSARGRLLRMRECVIDGDHPNVPTTAISF